MKRASMKAGSIGMTGGIALAIVAMGVGTAEGDERRLEKEVVVKASLDAVWHCWATSEGIASFFSPESNIGTRPGDPYEMSMGMAEPDESGGRGSEGCKLLSIIPKEMISFEWNFWPAVPSLRNAHAKTYVVVRFDELDGGRVRVRFAQLGWQTGEDWDKGYAYFDEAWDWVLGSLKTKLEEKAPASPTSSKKSKIKTSRDKHVKITASYGPVKRQEFEMIVPAPVERVWHVLATTDGYREVLASKAEIGLRPWGKYAVWPGADNKVLSYVPMEMLSTSGSAPPQFPNVRKGGTWSAYFLEPAGTGKTKLRRVVVGWKHGEEWDRAFAYFLRNNPVYLNHLYDKLAVDPE